MPGGALSIDEREQIAVGVAVGRSVAQIADGLGRAASTVRRELARNGGRARYSAVRAQRRAVRERARPKPSRFESDPVLARYVDERLALLDSPMTISIELAHGLHATTASVSHETIYQALYRRRGLSVSPRECLHLKRRRRRPRRNPTDTACSTHPTHSLGSYRSIAERPAIAADRVEVGHLEGDLITGAYNRSAMITLFDRASRRCWLLAVADKTADAVHDALVAVFDTIPTSQRRTLTWDQGSELARHRDLTERCGIDIYICDKNAPWQRPTNENGNALLRRYVGKGTELDKITDQRRQWIEHRINTIPRRSLDWHTATDVHARLSAPTT